MGFVQTAIPWQQDLPIPVLGWHWAAHVYRWVVQLRLWLYQRRALPIYRLPVPVVSIGNLTVGGTGKTPMTIALAQVLEAQGFRVVVLSRGYHAPQISPSGEATDPVYGDEAFLIQCALQQGKVFLGKNRVQVARRAIRTFQPDVILLDDGYQHLRLHRDCNLLLIDGTEGFGNEHLLPAGPMREPLDGIRRADWIVLTKDITPTTTQRVKALLAERGLSTPVLHCPFVTQGIWFPESQQWATPTDWKHLPVLLLSGIANPNQFRTSVQQAVQPQILAEWTFPDHTVYTETMLAPIVDHVAGNPLLHILTTEKDWVKLQYLMPPALYKRIGVFRVAPQLDVDPLLEAVLSLIRLHPGPHND